MCSSVFLSTFVPRNITEQGFAKILMSIIGHFIIEPIIYGAIIYYPVQCVIALLGTIFPYIMSLIIPAIVAGSWMYTRVANFRYHSVVLVALGVLLTVAFGHGAYSIHSTYAPHPIELAPGDSTSNIGQTDEQVADEAEEAVENTEDMIDEGEGMVETTGEGLFGSLPEGTSVYVGEMNGNPIEMTFSKEEVNINGSYKDVNSGATMSLDGESLPAQGGDITFHGNLNNSNWTFFLIGTADNITGTGSNDGNEYSITLHKK